MPLALMYRLPSALLLLALASGSAGAVTLTNADSTAIDLQVTESGGRSDISIAPGATEDICPSGCFLTLPNGDRLGLAGPEKIEIKGGTARVN